MTTIAAPSVNTLVTSLNVDRKTAKKIRAVIKVRGSENVRELLESFQLSTTLNWIRSCYHEPKPGEVRAAALDELLETHGVEYLFDCESEGLRADPGCDQEGSNEVLCYCNAGDAYAATLVRYRGRWQVSSYGDCVEHWERHNRTAAGH